MIGVGVALTIAGCGNVFVDLPETSGECGGAGGSSSSAATTGGGTCLVATDCPGVDTTCSARTCVDGACSYRLAPPGFDVFPDRAAGDCLGVQCDGSGVEVVIRDPFDPPVVTECRTTTCDPGPVTGLRPDGAACSVGSCKAGECVAP